MDRTEASDAFNAGSIPVECTIRAREGFPQGIVLLSPFFLIVPSMIFLRFCGIACIYCGNTHFRMKIVFFFRINDNST